MWLGFTVDFKRCLHFRAAIANQKALEICERQGVENKQNWTSLVVQWLRICLPIQETWVRSLLWKIPLTEGRLSLKAEQLRKPKHPGACALQQKKPPHRASRSLCPKTKGCKWKELAPTRGSPRAAAKTQCSRNEYILKKLLVFKTLIGFNISLNQKYFQTYFFLEAIIL